MAYAILRTAKLKAPANVAASASHIERTRQTHNARPGVANVWLEGGPGMYAEAEKVWAKIPKKRSDAVHGIEVLLTASPEAFEQGMDANAWAAQSMAWVRKAYPGCVIVGACMHLDESTPHIHAILIPVEAKPDGTLQLNAKRHLGSAKKLSMMQTSYAKAMEQLGLERGIKGSKAKHVTIGQFYGQINAGSPVKFRPIQVEKPPAMLLGSAREAWAKEQIKAVIATLKEPIQQLRAESSQAQDLKRQNRDLKRSNAALSASNEELRRKEQARQLRDLPLERVAKQLGCYKSPKTVAKDKDLWESPAGKLSIKDTKFFNQETGFGDGGAISLVMHINACNYGEALGWLRDEFNPTAAVEAAVEAARISAQAEVQKAPAAPFRAPEHVEASWPRVREYLVNVRALAGALVDKLRSTGWLGADARNNAYFVKQDGNKLTSVELKGTGRSLFTGSRGRSSEGVFMVEGGTEKLAVCESPIDAISYVQLHPQSTAIATGGAGKWKSAINYLVKYRDRFQSVVCASDNNEAGVEMALNLGLDHEPPPNGIEDWNDAVRALREDPKALEPAMPKKPKSSVRAPAEPRLSRKKANGSDESIDLV